MTADEHRSGGASGSRIGWVATYALLWGGFLVVYAGFFVTGDDVHRAGPRLVAWAGRIGMPIALLFLLSLLHMVRRGRLPAMALGVAGLTFVAAAVVLYPVASRLYADRVLGKNLSAYHPYLQLSPRDVAMRSGTGDEPPIRVFCLGGSTTEFVDGTGQGWPARVEEQLNGDLSAREVQVYNQGRQWYSSLHLLIHYQTNLRRHHPDVIVVMEAINDLLHNADFSRFSFAPFQPDYRHYHGPAYRLIYRQSLAREAAGMLRSVWYAKPRSVIDTTDFPGLASYTNNLACLIDLARADGTQVVLMTQPHRLKPDMTDEEIRSLNMVNTEAIGDTQRWSPETARSGMDQYNQALRALARQKGVLLIDLEADMPKSTATFYDEVHYTGDAFGRVADRVAAGLQPVIDGLRNP